MPDIEDLLGDAEQRRERAVAMLTPPDGAVSATVTRIRRRRALRRGAQLAVAVPVMAAIGVGAWAATGRSDTPPPASTPTVTTTPAPTTSPTPSSTPEPSTSPAAPAVTEPAVTDAVRASMDVEREWFRMGGQVPVDAPLSTFPVSPAPIDFGGSGDFGCTRAQFDWLLAHGTAGNEGYDGAELEPPAASGSDTVVPARTYTLTSDAATDATLQNLRVEGTVSDGTPARLRFGCINGGIGGDGAPFVEVADAGTSAPATYAVLPGFAENWYPPEEWLPADKLGTPFATTLPAGGSFDLNLVLAGVDPARDFRGRVVADAVIDGVTYQTVIDADLELPAPPSVTSIYAVAGFGRLFCLPDEQTYYDAVSAPTSVDLAQYECTPQELAAAVGSGS